MYIYNVNKINKLQFIIKKTKQQRKIDNIVNNKIKLSHAEKEINCNNKQLKSVENFQAKIRCARHYSKTKFVPPYRVCQRHYGC